MFLLLNSRKQNSGRLTFTLVWSGQLVSLIGSGITSFALDIWVYQQNESVTQFAIASLCGTLPFILISPLAGSLIDRWNRRIPMILGDLGAGLSTLTIALVLLSSSLEIWHVYLATAAISCFAAFQVPAYMAAIPSLVPKHSLDRANGMIQMGHAIAQLVAPVLGGVLLVTIGLKGIILLDFATFLVALATLLSVRFPDVRRTREKARTSVWRDSLEGWAYVAARPGLVGLVIFFAASNFLIGMVTILATPFILSFASAAVLGTIVSISGFGMLLGGLVMSASHGIHGRMTRIFSCTFLSGLAMLAAGLRPSVPLFTCAAFVFFFCIPVIQGSSHTIFQQKVQPDLQGRVFVLIAAISGASLPLSYLIAGPLADQVFEPLMAAGGALAGSIGQFIGTGQGRGIGLLFMIAGALAMLASLLASRYPRLRLLEEELPDTEINPIVVDAAERNRSASGINNYISPEILAMEVASPAKKVDG